MPGFSIETNPLCNIVYGDVPMSVTGGIFDIQLVHAACLCLCSQTKLVVCGRGATLCDLLGCIHHLKVNTTQFTQKITVISNGF